MGPEGMRLHQWRAALVNTASYWLVGPSKEGGKEIGSWRSATKADERPLDFALAIFALYHVRRQIRHAGKVELIPCSR